MTAWVDINLPYSIAPQHQLMAYPDVPDLSKYEEAIFGHTENELRNMIDFIKWVEIKDRIEDEMELEGFPAGAQWETESQKRVNDLAGPELARSIALLARIRAWQISEAKDLPEHQAFDAEYERVSSFNRSLTFQGRGLDLPGTQIEMADGSRYLIGDICPNRGRSSMYAPFEGDAIVICYRRLITSGMCP